MAGICQPHWQRYHCHLVYATPECHPTCSSATRKQHVCLAFCNCRWSFWHLQLQMKLQTMVLLLMPHNRIAGKAVIQGGQCSRFTFAFWTVCISQSPASSLPGDPWLIVRFDDHYHCFSCDRDHACYHYHYLYSSRYSKDNNNATQSSIVQNIECVNDASAQSNSSLHGMSMAAMKQFACISSRIYSQLAACPHVCLQPVWHWQLCYSSPDAVTHNCQTMCHCEAELICRKATCVQAANCAVLCRPPCIQTVSTTSCPLPGSNTPCTARLTLATWAALHCQVLHSKTCNRFDA